VATGCDTSSAIGGSKGSFLRIAALLAFVGLAAADLVCAAVANIPGQAGRLGVVFSNNQINEVIPGGAAAAAGIKPGDRIDLQRLYPIRAQSLDPFIWYLPAPGTDIKLPILRGNAHLTESVRTGRSTFPIQGYIPFLLIVLLIVTFAAWMVFAAPNVSTWTFFLFIIGLAATFSGNQAALVFAHLGYWPTLAFSALINILAALPVSIIAFASAVPDNIVAGWRLRVLWAAVALYVVAVAVNLYSIVAWSVLGMPERYVVLPDRLEGMIELTLPLVAGIVVLAFKFFTSEGPSRERIKWILGGVVALSISSLPYIVYLPFAGLNTWLHSAMDLLFIISMAAISYGVIRSHVVTVKFAISYAVTFSLFAAGALLLVAVSEFTFERFAIIFTRTDNELIDFMIVLACVVAFNAFHGRVNRFVNQVLFKTRYNALRRLEKDAHAVLYADTAASVREVLIDEPVDALALGSAALFESDPAGGWTRTHDLGWEAATFANVSPGDGLILRLNAEQKPQHLAEFHWSPPGLPKGVAQPVLALAIATRRKIKAVALYGRHITGTALDADEVRSLREIADAAGIALEYLASEDLRLQMKRAQDEASALRLQLSQVYETGKSS